MEQSFPWIPRRAWSGRRWGLGFQAPERTEKTFLVFSAIPSLQQPSETSALRVRVCACARECD